MSGGTLVLRYAPKIAEMNDSDPYLFKTSKILKIDSVFLKMQLGKDGNKTEIWGHPASVMRRHHYISYCLRFLAVKPSKFCKRWLFWLIREDYQELELLVANTQTLYNFQRAKKIFFVILDYKIIFWLFLKPVPTILSAHLGVGTV